MPARRSPGPRALEDCEILSNRLGPQFLTHSSYNAWPFPSGERVCCMLMRGRPGSPRIYSGWGLVTRKPTERLEGGNTSLPPWGERLETGCSDLRFNPSCPHDETPVFTNNPTRRAREICRAGEHTRGRRHTCGELARHSPPCLVPQLFLLPLTCKLCNVPVTARVSLSSGSSSEFLALRGAAGTPASALGWAEVHVPRGPRLQLALDPGGQSQETARGLWGLR